VKPLRAIVDLPIKDWQGLGEQVVIKTVTELRRKHYYKSKKYSKQYKKRKMEGKAARQQASRSGVPDATLTGLTLDTFKFKRVIHGSGGRAAGAVIGWDDPAAAQRVEHASRHKRPIIPSEKKPLLPPVKKFFDKHVDKLYDKAAHRVSGRRKPIVINL